MAVNPENYSNFGFYSGGNGGADGSNGNNGVNTFSLWRNGHRKDYFQGLSSACANGRAYYEALLRKHFTGYFCPGQSLKYPDVDSSSNISISVHTKEDISNQFLSALANQLLLFTGTGSISQLFSQYAPDISTSYPDAASMWTAWSQYDDSAFESNVLMPVYNNSHLPADVYSFFIDPSTLLPSIPSSAQLKAGAKYINRDDSGATVTATVTKKEFHPPVHLGYDYYCKQGNKLKEANIPTIANAKSAWQTYIQSQLSANNPRFTYLSCNHFCEVYITCANGGPSGAQNMATVVTDHSLASGSTTSVVADVPGKVVILGGPFEVHQSGFCTGQSVNSITIASQQPALIVGDIVEADLTSRSPSDLKDYLNSVSSRRLSPTVGIVAKKIAIDTTQMSPVYIDSNGHLALDSTKSLAGDITGSVFGGLVEANLTTVTNIFAKIATVDAPDVTVVGAIATGTGIRTHRMVRDISNVCSNQGSIINYFTVPSPTDGSGTAGPPTGRVNLSVIKFTTGSDLASN